MGDAGVGPGGAEDQDDGLVQGTVPGVAARGGGPGGAAVVGACLAELAEGDGVAAGFGQEVADPRSCSWDGRLPLRRVASLMTVRGWAGSWLPIVPEPGLAVLDDVVIWRRRAPRGSSLP